MASERMPCWRMLAKVMGGLFVCSNLVPIDEACPESVCIVEHFFSFYIIGSILEKSFKLSTTLTGDGLHVLAVIDF
jgi:hypothetical protein